MRLSTFASSSSALLPGVTVVVFALVAACSGGSSVGGQTVAIDGGVLLDTAPSFDGAAPSETGDDSGDDDALPPAVDIFADQPPYVTHAGSSTSQIAHHGAHAIKEYQKMDCGSSGCHDAASFASNPEQKNILFGGTVYWIDDNTPARGVEIRLVDANGVGYSVFSDVDGVFYRAAPAGTTSTDAFWPAHTGARAGTDDVLMSTPVDRVGCNASKCHDGSTEYPWITVPRPTP